MLLWRNLPLYCATYDPTSKSFLHDEGSIPACCTVTVGNTSCSSGKHFISEGGTLPDESGKSFYTVEVSESDVEASDL